MKAPKAILLTLLYLVIYFIPQLILVGLVKYIPFFEEKPSEHFYLVVIIGSLLSYFILFYFFWKPRPDVNTDLFHKPFNVNLLPYLILIVLGLGFIAQPFFDFDMIIAYYANDIEPIPYKFAGFTTYMIYYTISSLLIAPVFEELFFRKFLFGKLLEQHKLWLAILISSLCFAAIHFETPKNLIFSFIFGVIACLIYVKTKNIWYPMAIHFLNNLFVLLYNVFGESFFIWVYSHNFGVMYWALFVFGILITVLGTKTILKSVAIED